MAWQIHSWSKESGTGTVVSPHFGPWPFGPDQNPERTTDFVLGEEVVVTLGGNPGAYVVESVVTARPPLQPKGTECPVFEGINHASPYDMVIVKRSATAIAFWLGDCCEWCCDGWALVFTGVQTDIDEDTFLDSPLLRFASAQEIRVKEEEGLGVPSGSTMYCIVSDYTNRGQGARHFIVAEGVKASPSVEMPSDWSDWF